ncbi:hypothetical protein EW146_g8220 [Bondarzewia mesenterica]|uniref:Uncharacterized protein n=1 Tax=Bondarzewia mesenterica TaxID=1095465 RepID=A0A4S4LHZ6_9AGAM|nr:hypothetical protein EW146_g8220 [Bondarzewia mesenterica]
MPIDNSVPDEFVLLPVEALANTLRDFNIDINVHDFIQQVNAELSTPDPSSSTQQSQEHAKAIQKAAIEALNRPSIPVPPSAKSIFE